MKIPEEMLALTYAILRLLPNYQKYRSDNFEVKLDWTEDRKQVDVTYSFHGVVFYAVKVSAFDENDRAKISMETVQTFHSTDTWRSDIRMEDLYLFLGVIAKTNYQNDREENDTDFVITRYW